MKDTIPPIYLLKVLNMINGKNIWKRKKKSQPGETIADKVKAYEDDLPRRPPLSHLGVTSTLG